MSMGRSDYVTPFKLLQKPQPVIGKTFNGLPLRQAFLTQTKTPKLFSALRPPSVPQRSKVYKCLSPDLPSFLGEYLNESVGSVRTSQRKTLTQVKLLRKKSFKKENKIGKIKAATPAPQMHEKSEKIGKFEILEKLEKFELLDSRKILSGNLYKPYIVKISPRSKIRLYSPSPIGPLHDSSQENRKKTRKSNFYTNPECDSNKESDTKAIRVSVENYSKDYAEKLRKVLEIKEQARIEVERLQL